MGHSIHTIVAPIETADKISIDWPQLPRLNCDNGFAIFPIDSNLIDERIAPDKTPTTTGEEFMLLTNGFRDLLRVLSRGGQLAYVETEYFGGVGGQGAVVCRDGVEIMPPIWQTSGAINDALKLVGVKRTIFGDAFDVLGFGDLRSNDDLLELIAARAANGDA